MRLLISATLLSTAVVLSACSSSVQRFDYYSQDRPYSGLGMSHDAAPQSPRR